MLVKLNDYIMKWSLAKHEEWKPQLLELIEKQKEGREVNDAGYYFDWDDDRIDVKTGRYYNLSSSRPYSSLFFHCISEPVWAYAKHFGSAPFMGGNQDLDLPSDLKPELSPSVSKRQNPVAWFQQYFQPNTGFGWHSHDKSVAVIYFVELPNPKDATEFYLEGQFDLKEGDVMIWPSYLNHRSPPLSSAGRKTIIATNIDLFIDRKVTGDGK